MHRPSLRALAVVAAVGAAAPLHAQVVRGRVLDAASGEGVAGARVTVLGAGDRAAGRTDSGPDGAFRVELRTAGTVRIRAERQGLEPTVTRAVEVGARDTLEVEVRVSAAPLVVEGLTVTARRAPRRVPALDAIGFYQREATGLGRFLHRDEIERGGTMNLVQVLDRIPGAQRLTIGRGVASREVVVFTRSSSAGALRRAQTGGGEHCLPQLYVDGNLVTYGDQGMNSLVQPEQVEAIEVYSSPSQLPPEYRSSGSVCGVIVVWTRKSQ